MPASTALDGASRPIFHQSSGDVGLRTIISIVLVALSILAASLCFVYGSSFLSMYCGVTFVLGAAITIVCTLKSNLDDNIYGNQEAAYFAAFTLGAPIAPPILVASVISDCMTNFISPWLNR